MSEAKQEVDTVRMWEIARYVESHPDNHEQRWRLAKKLYASWEYRLALEHLLVLKEEWQRRVNVVRYLAATYYRLGSYDEAEQELREALHYWPNDLGLREQLARVLETCGKREAAAEMWEDIKALQPAHSLADSAVRRLRHKEAPHSAQENLHIGDSDSGIDLSPGQVCPNCGAQNGDDFDRCWQCHASLFGGSSGTHRSTPRIQSRGDRVLGMAPETVRLVGGLSVVGLLTLCLYLSLRLVLLWHAASAVPVVRSVQHLYAGQLGLSRVLAGAAMLLLAPLLLTAAIQLLKPRRGVSGSLLSIGALFGASLIFLSSWLGLEASLAAWIGVTMLLAAWLYWGLRLAPLQSVGGALLNALFLLLAGGTTFAAAEYVQTSVLFNPVVDIPAFQRHAALESPGEDQGVVSFPPGVTPYEVRGVTWLSTGSAWLDRRAGQVAFRLSTPAAAPNFKFEIQDSKSTRLYEPVTTSQFQCVFLIQPGEPYTLRTAMGDAGIPVSLAATGFLRPRIPEQQR